MRALPGHDRARPRRPRRGASARPGRRSRSTAPSTCASARTASRASCPPTPRSRSAARPRCADGADVTLASTGAILPEALAAADLLAPVGRRRRPCSTSARVKPFDAARSSRPPRAPAPSSPSRSTASAAASAAPRPRRSRRRASARVLRRAGFPDTLRPRGRLQQHLCAISRSTRTGSSAPHSRFWRRPGATGVRRRRTRRASASRPRQAPPPSSSPACAALQSTSAVLPGSWRPTSSLYCARPVRRVTSDWRCSPVAGPRARRRPVRLPRRRPRRRGLGAGPSRGGRTARGAGPRRSARGVFGAPADYLREPLATFRANTDGLLRLYSAAPRSAPVTSSTSAAPRSTASLAGTAMPTQRGATRGGSRARHRCDRSTASPSAWRRCSAPCSRSSAGSRSGACGRGTSAARGSASTTGACPWPTCARRSDGRRARWPATASALAARASYGSGLLQVSPASRRRRRRTAFNVGDPSGEESTMLALARRCAVAAGLAADGDAVRPW